MKSELYLGPINSAANFETNSIAIKIRNFLYQKEIIGNFIYKNVDTLNTNYLTT